MALRSIYKYGSKAQGLALLAFGSISFLMFVYAGIVSKLLPPFDNPILAAIQNDRRALEQRYYCFLVPSTLPILVVAIYFHWLSMKIFKHA